MRIVFFGTPDFAKKQLLYLLENKIHIIAVVTQPDKPQGRKQRLLPPPVKEAYLERKLNIPLFQPVRASEKIFLQELKDLKPDLFIVVAYGQILRQVLLDIPLYGCINVHASLLPKYRGAAPIQRAIMAGEKETGITIMKMVLKLDAGDMLLVEKVPILEDMTFDQVEESLSEVSGPALLKVIEQYKESAVISVPQNEELATYAHKISPEDLLLDFNEDARVVHNKIRALSPKPGAYCNVLVNNKIKRVKILKSKVRSISKNPYENIEFSSKRWIVACGKDSIEVVILQVEGKKAMNFNDYVKGHSQELHIKKL